MTTRENVRSGISEFCRKLTLSQTIVRLCEGTATFEQESFLHAALLKELENRALGRRDRFLKQAGFPGHKTLEGYNFTTLKLPSHITANDLMTCSFIKAKRNIVMYGPVGTGKTHLAIALGVKACELGYQTRFFTAAELVNLLSEAKKVGNLQKLINDLSKSQLLIIDEWGYVPVDREGAQLLFRIVTDAYESRSLIITTNLEFSKWGNIFTDDQMAAAMIDRLAHHGYLFLFEGESYRMKNALMKKK